MTGSEGCCDAGSRGFIDVRTCDVQMLIGSQCLADGARHSRLAAYAMRDGRTVVSKRAGAARCARPAASMMMMMMMMRWVAVILARR